MTTLISPFTVRHSADLNTDSTRYFNFANQAIGTLATDADMESVVLPYGVIGGRISVELDVAPGSGNSRTFEIWNRTKDESISVTISDTATYGDSGDDTVSWDAGDVIVGRASGAGTADTASTWWPYMELHATDRMFMFGGCGNFGGISTSTRWFPVWGIIVESGIGDRVRTLFTINATVREVSMWSDNAPGSSQTATGNLIKNDSDAGTTDPSISDPDQSDVVTGLTLDIAPGDWLTWSGVESGTAVNSLNFGLAYEPDTAGEGMLICCGTLDTAPADNEHLMGNGNGWSTWANRGSRIDRDVTITEHWVNTQNAPGTGDTVELSIAIDDDGGGNAVNELSGAAEAEETWTGTLAITAGEYVAERYDVTAGTPAIGSMFFAWSCDDLTLGGGSQTVTVTSAIATAESVPSPTVSPGAVTVAPSSAIATAESVPQPDVDLHIALGAAIASAEAVPSPTVTPGAVTVSPSTAIASGEDVPEPVVTPGAVTVSPDAIASGESVPSPIVTQGGVIVTQDTTISSAESVNAPIVAGPISVSSAIASGESVPNPTVSPGAVTVSPDAIDTAESVPQPEVQPGAVTVSPSSAISTGESVPNPQVDLTIYPDALATGESVPNPTVTPGAVTVSPDAIASAEAVYDPLVTFGQFVYPGDVIASGEAFFNPWLWVEHSRADYFPADAADAPSFTVETGSVTWDVESQ